MKFFSVFFFKQKTAYEMRISDLSSDVCSSDLLAVDGEVVEGRSAVDQSLVTGEPMPVDRQAGDKVIGGTINGTGTLLVRVTAVGADRFLQRVAREVEDARAVKIGRAAWRERVCQYV